ncbi:MAG: type II toxin-antitoxin system death-on-curing family toxin [Methylovirgula sp.]
MDEPEWIIKAVVLAAHDEQLAEHGGQEGLRDEGLLESALARPRDRYSYGEADIFELAAAYAFGLAKNHPFLDGNKRVSLVVSVGFLLLNGFKVTAEEAAKLPIWLLLAEGKFDESELAAWFRAHAEPVKD